MGSVLVKPEAAVRSIGMLRTAMTDRRGHAQPGRPAVDRPFGRGPQRHREATVGEKRRSASCASSPIHVGAEVHPGSPRLSAELPETGERFAAPALHSLVISAFGSVSGYHIDGGTGECSDRPRSSVGGMSPLNDFCRRNHVGRSFVYEQIRDGKLIAVKVGARTYITYEAGCRSSRPVRSRA
jgi:hypothetical protein